MQNLYKEDLVDLINDIQHPVWIFDLESLRFLTVNRSAVMLLGYTQEEFLAMTIKDIRSEYEVSYYEANQQWRIYTIGVNHFQKLRKKNGSEIFAEVRYKDITYKESSAKITTMYDLTDKINYELRLRESEERFRISQEISPDGFTIMRSVRDKDGSIINFEWEYVNPAAVKILRIPAEELIGAKLLDKLPGNSLELFELYKEEVNTGKPHDLEIKYNADNIDGWFRNMTVKLRDGVAVSFHDITQRKLQQQEIQKKNRDLNNVLERISDAFVAMDREWRVTYLNYTAMKIFSTDESILGKNFWDAFPIYKGTNFYLDSVRAMQQQEAKVIDFEGILTPRWYKISVYPSQEGVSIYAVDITLSKAYEEHLMSSLKQKETLLKEVHHRIKNNLQIIISILNLQSHYIQDPQALEIFRQSQNRIRSMALIHEKLYKSDNLVLINLENYISDIVKYLSATYGVRKDLISIQLDIEQIHLDSNTAISIGLIVNELISNSIKHAFSSQKKGKIVIQAWRKGNNMNLSVSDDGKGLPFDLNNNHTKTLGLQLVNTLISQLNGTLEYENQSGAEIKICFPYLYNKIYAA